jgi:U3 small nucleolar RNA-associated protein 20
VVLAKDLREEFYGYFPRFFDKLLDLLNTSDANQLEWVLVCLAFLFKTLKSFLKKELIVIFNKILPLLADHQPLHITNFAAECFSFIARDVQNKEKFVQSILKSLAGHPEGITGCGRLFFEMMRGVNENFHSSTPTFLTVLLQSLASDTLDRQLLFETLVQTVTDMLSCIAPKNLEVFWNVAYPTLDKFLELPPESPVRDTSIRHLLTLMGQVVEHKDGRYLVHINLLIKYLLKTIDEHLEESTLMCVSRIAVLLFTSTAINITQLDASRLSKRMLNINSTAVFSDFVRHSVAYSQFELLILPDFLKYLERHFDMELVSLLANILAEKAPLCRTGINLNAWTRYPIVLKQQESLKRLAKHVQNVDMDNLDAFLVIALCYPHIVNADAAGLCEKLVHIIDNCLDGLADKSRQKKTFYILSVASELLIHLDVDLVEHLKIVNAVAPFGKGGENVVAVRLLDLCLQSFKNKKGECFHKFSTEERSFQKYAPQL